MKEIFKRFNRLWRNAESEADCDEVLRELKKVEEREALPVNMLILKGMCIQLGSDNCIVLNTQSFV